MSSGVDFVKKKKERTREVNFVADKGERIVWKEWNFRSTLFNYFQINKTKKDKMFVKYPLAEVRTYDPTPTFLLPSPNKL